MRTTVAFGALLAVTVLLQPVPPIVIDGTFDDWKSVANAVLDPLETSTIAADFREVRATADERSVSMLVHFERDVNVLDLPGMLSLLWNIDGDSATGETRFGTAGIDVVVELSEANGVAIRRGPLATSASQPPSSLGFVFGPSYSTDALELRMRRDLLQSGTATGRGLFAKLVYSENGALRDETEVIRIAPSPAAVAPTRPDEMPPISDPLARAPGTSFRVVVWNVNGIPVAARAQFLRIFRAIDADILLLNQVPPTASMESWLPPGTQPDQASWRVLMGIAVRGSAIPAFLGLPYPKEAPETLAALFFPNDPEQRATRRTQISNATVPGSGALAILNNRRILTTKVLLYPGGNAPDGPRELQRLMAAQVIREAVRLAKANFSPQAVLIGGDLNLVGTRRPLSTLESELDVDGSSLGIVNALDLQGLSNATWRPAAGNQAVARYPPGRLDWLLYSDSTLDLVRAFVFNTEDLHPQWLETHRLEREDSTSGRTSDHLPIVADFRWRK